VHRISPKEIDTVARMMKPKARRNLKKCCMPCKNALFFIETALALYFASGDSHINVTLTGMCCVSEQ